MTDDASADTREEDAAPDDYEQMLAHVDVAIEEAKQKVESGRVYDAENEKVRIKWIRALVYAVDVRRKVTTDRDLEELTRRIEELEAAREEVTAR
jgi:ribosomal protein L13E